MSYTSIPTDKEIPIQKYVKEMNEAKMAEKSKQKVIMKDKIIRWFDLTIQSIETDLPKWEQPIREIREKVSSEHNQVTTFALEQFHIGKLIDLSTYLITRQDIERILDVLYYRFSKTISKPNHPLEGCRVYLSMPLKGNHINIKVDTSEPSCCTLI